MPPKTLAKPAATAPVTRSTPDQIQEQHSVVAQHHELLAVLQNVPQIAFVLNDARQVVYGNQILLGQLGMTRLEEALGARAGELMQCIHAHANDSCGDAEGCRYCGAVLAVLESQASQQGVTREARVTVSHAGRSFPLDLSVTATPLALDSHRFTLVFISDISAQKRREYLEQIFLHDLLNSISGLKMMTDLLYCKTLPEDLRPGIADLNSHIDLITDDVRGHQLLLSAELGKLEIKITPVPVSGLIKSALHSVGALLSLQELVVQYEVPPPSLCIATDQRLARRVLVNALKNAIEASFPGEAIKIEIQSTLTGCTIAIHNPRAIPEAARHQIFQRSFTTKGDGRGLGTYSMRLLLEDFLDGEVSFTTSAEHGTTFLITLPSPLRRTRRCFKPISGTDTAT